MFCRHISSLSENIHRFTERYNATTDDIMRYYVQTTGVAGRVFKYQNLEMSIYDHAGCRAERKAWINSFDNTNVVVFTVDVTSWTRPLYEDHCGNEMCESFGLFEAIFNSRWFERSAKILVFTNVSALKTKLVSDPLADFFEDYQGGDDVDLAKKYLEDRFVSFCHQPAARPVKFIYTDFAISLTQPAEELLKEMKQFFRDVGVLQD